MRHKRPKRSAASHVPPDIPLHRTAIKVAVILVTTAFLLMASWFYWVTSGDGFLITKEQSRAAKANETAEDRAAAERDERAAAEADGGDAASGGQDSQPDSGDGASADAELPGADAEQPGPLDVPAQAPRLNDTTSGDWDLANWSVVAHEGTVKLIGDLENISGTTQSGQVHVTVYNDGRPLARTTYVAIGFPAWSRERVEFDSDQSWVPGTKKLVLRYESSG